MLNLFKKKKSEFRYIMVYKEIIYCDKFFTIHDFVNHKRKVIKRRYRGTMTVEDAKKELREYRENILYIKEQQDDIEELRGILEKTTTRLSPTRTDNNSMSTDKFSDGIDRIREIEKEKNKRLEELLVKKFVVDAKINQLEYPKRDVLFMRYSRGKDWDYISNTLKYSIRQVYKVHGKALLDYANL